MRPTAAGAPAGARARPVAMTSPPEVDAFTLRRWAWSTWCMALSSRLISASEGAPGEGVLAAGPGVVVAGFSVSGVGALGPWTVRRDCTKLLCASGSCVVTRDREVDRRLVAVVVTRTDGGVLRGAVVVRAPAFTAAWSWEAEPQPARATAISATGAPARRSRGAEPPPIAPRLAGA